MAHHAEPHGTETADGHIEHTGHGGHHVFDGRTLKVTFGILVGLTILTVVLAFFERGRVDIFGVAFDVPEIPFGPLSVPVALGIASVKTYFVAANFMGLKHDKGVPLLTFLGSILFVGIFLGISYLDFGFRDTFDEMSAVSADVLEQQTLEAAAETEAIQDAFDAVPLVYEADPALFGGDAVDPEPSAAAPQAPVDAPDGTPAIDGSESAPAPDLNPQDGELADPDRDGTAEN